VAVIRAARADFLRAPDLHMMDAVVVIR
jgi:hypothetical protein